MLIDIDLVARTGGIRFLLHALGEGPTEMGPILASTFLYIVDSPRTRSFLTVGSDLEVGEYFVDSKLINILCYLRSHFPLSLMPMAKAQIMPKECALVPE